MANFLLGAAKAAKVLLYHVGSIFLVGLGVYLASHASVPAWFLSALAGFGIPVAIVNAIWAGLEEFLLPKLPNGTTIDTAPPTGGTYGMK